MWYIILAVVFAILFVIVIPLLVNSSSRDDSETYKAEFFVKKTPEEVGKEGQKKVENVLDSIDEHHYIINSFRIKIGEHMNDIDHIYINNYGVFVLETKTTTTPNITVIGDADSEYWKYVYPSGKKWERRNPIKQNSTHKIIVQRIIGKKYPVKAYVVYVNNPLKCVNLQNVIRLEELPTVLHSGDKMLSNRDMDRVYSLLNKSNEDIDDAQLIENINETH